MREIYAEALRLLPNVEVCVAADGRQAEDYLKQDPFDLLVSDIRMPKMDGLALLRAAKTLDPELPVLILTAFPDIEIAVQSIKQGASDYLIKSSGPEELISKATRILHEKAIGAENQFLEKFIEGQYKFDELIGISVAMKKVFADISLFSVEEMAVIITGESGTGKELVARSIHKRSERKSFRFVPVNCGAIPENLMENEFFGHEKGAYSGADTLEMGLMDFVDGGTLFLDEICELPLFLQAKLLRVLEDGTFRRVGGKKEIRVNIRVVAATNRDIDLEVDQKRFRRDLFYRINVARIHIPPLRERQEDIPVLCRHFLERLAKERGKALATIQPSAMKKLLSYPWQGNVRELQSALKRALIQARSLEICDFDLSSQSVQPSDEKGEFLMLLEARKTAFGKRYFRMLVERWPGDLKGAAKEAGISLATLYRNLREYGIPTKGMKP